MIKLQNVSKRYEGLHGLFLAIDNVSLDIKANEIFGIIGESGAGKSTLLRFMNDLETPDTGKVSIDGIAMSSLDLQGLRRLRKSIGMIFQQFNLLYNKTVAENVRLPLTLHSYDNPLSVEEVLEFVGLSDKINSYPTQLSGGQKQRVGIARALIPRPNILLCDEPTSALDAAMTDEIVSVLRKAHESLNITIVLVTHELNVVRQLCHRAAVLEAGKIVDVLEINNSTSPIEKRSYHQRVLEVLGDD